MTPDELRTGWIAWFERFGAAKFYDAFMRNAQYAESRCVHCREPIYLDIAEGGGVPDWRTDDGDYGCGDSPATNDEGTGSHMPVRLKEGAR